MLFDVRAQEALEAAREAKEAAIRKWRAAYWAAASSEATKEAEARIEEAERDRRRIENELLAFDDAE